MSEKAWQKLQTVMGELADLRGASAVLGWDQQVNMPAAGAPARSQQMALLQQLAHERLTDPALGELLEELAQAPPDDVSADQVKAMQRQHRQAARVPTDLVVALSKASSEAYQAWLAARDEQSFGPFRQPLAELVRLNVEKAEALGYETERYDALLDLYEPEMKAAQVDQLFSQLQDFLVPFLQTLTPRLDTVDDGLLRQNFPADKQWELTLAACRAIGFDFDRGRQDRSVHPFTTSFAIDDVRITTRIDPDYLAAGLYASLHETGHALYEQGIDPAFRRTALSRVNSLGLHESQSRLYENLVGRSLPFWQYFLPKAAEIFPRQLAGVDAQQIYRAVNRVSPSLIRVEADEVTYPLHIMLRFDLERALITGDLAVDDLPGAFDDGLDQYVGLRPQNVVEGVLQDIHWSAGYFGYFPTYTLGTLMSVQIFNAAQTALPDLATDLAAGRFLPLRDWLQHNVHRHGSRLLPQELMEQVTGQPLAAQPFIDYVQDKYSELYGL